MNYVPFAAVTPPAVHALRTGVDGGELDARTDAPWTRRIFPTWSTYVCACVEESDDEEDDSILSDRPVCGLIRFVSIPRWPMLQIPWAVNTLVLCPQKSINRKVQFVQTVLHASKQLTNICFWLNAAPKGWVSEATGNEGINQVRVMIKQLIYFVQTVETINNLRVIPR